jgi:hydroxymethylpyrimidine pyrophosphatase-like HAD family hydrolase
MELCGYAAAMGNATQELKDLVLARGVRGFIGEGVDHNGILGIFDHFLPDFVGQK